MLEKDQAIRTDIVFYGKPDKNGNLRKQKVLIYNCSKCNVEIRCQEQYLKRHSGKCVYCAQFNAPFKAAYNELIKSCNRRNHKITLTYEDLLEFTKIDKCHYCSVKIHWHPHTKNKGKVVPGSRSYKLDRMDNYGGYTKDNCVVCCWKCNSAKGNRFSYEEWYGMTAYFRNQNLTTTAN